MQETIVRLKVLSLERTPDQITATIGLPYDSCWRIGDIRSHTIIKEEDNGWVLSSGLPRSAGLEEHVDMLLSLLDSRADLVRSLSTTSSIEFSCVIYADTPPAINFDESVITKLASLGASLDIDLYIVACDISG
jgi:hypothetical protein